MKSYEPRAKIDPLSFFQVMRKCQIRLLCHISFNPESALEMLKRLNLCNSMLFQIIETKIKSGLTQLTQ